MKEQSPNDNWRLEEEDFADEKWLLEESEQRVTDQWELHASQNPEEVTSWQPVEYVKPNRPAGAWILPTVITLALLIVIGYTASRVLPPLFGTGETEPTQAAIVPPIADEEETPTEAPALVETPEGTMAEETPAAPEQEVAVPTSVVPAEDTATPIPTVSEQVVVEFAVVTPTFGLNARVAPDPNAEIIRILDPDESVLIFSRQGEWLEVFINETPLVEGEPLAGTVGYAAADFMEVVTGEMSEQLYNEILTFTGKQPVSTPEETEAAPGTEETPTAGQDSVAPLTVTVNSLSGVNVRRDPSATSDENVVRLLENGTVIPAIARTADDGWVQVELPDGVTGWVAVEFLVLSDDITTLPTPEEVVPEADTTSTPIESTTVVTTGVAVDAPYSNILPTDDVPAIIVEIPEGVNARTSPDLEADIETLVPQGVVLPASGRSSDNQWVQVQLPTGIEAWIFRTTITETPAVGALPAVLTELPTPAPVAPGEQILIPTPTPADATPEPETTTVTASVLPFILPVYPDASSDGTPVLRAQRGTTFTVTGRNEGGEWLQVETADGTVGWVIAGNVNVTGDPATLPVAQ